MRRAWRGGGGDLAAGWRNWQHHAGLQYFRGFENRFGPLTTKHWSITCMCRRLLSPADAAGLQWYVDELAAGRTTLQTVALDILNGAQNKKMPSHEANQVTVSAHAVTLFEDAGVVLTESTLQEGLGCYRRDSHSVRSL